MCVNSCMRVNSNTHTCRKVSSQRRCKVHVRKNCTKFDLLTLCAIKNERAEWNANWPHCKSPLKVNCKYSAPSKSKKYVGCCAETVVQEFNLIATFLQASGQIAPFVGPLADGECRAFSVPIKSGHGKSNFPIAGLNGIRCTDWGGPRRMGIFGKSLLVTHETMRNRRNAALWPVRLKMSERLAWHSISDTEIECFMLLSLSVAGFLSDTSPLSCYPTFDHLPNRRSHQKVRMASKAFHFPSVRFSALIRLITVTVVDFSRSCRRHTFLLPASNAGKKSRVFGEKWPKFIDGSKVAHWSQRNSHWTNSSKTSNVRLCRYVSTSLSYSVTNVSLAPKASAIVRLCK